jgi:hypothetical protein
VDAAAQLYARLVESGVDGIEDLIAQREVEGEILDFKRLKNNTVPMHRDDIVNYSIAVSGFSNATGGIIVWGIDARRGNDGIDGASKKERISGLNHFVSELYNKLPVVVEPGVEGVLHTAIEDPAGSDDGYVITFIPGGQGLPVMAKAKDTHRYYYRKASTFEIMSHWQLADRFGRRPQPKLTLRWHPFEYRPNEKWKIVETFSIDLVNEGLGAALYPSATLGVLDEVIWATISYGAVLDTQLKGPTRRLLVPKFQQALPPQQPLPLLYLRPPKEMDGKDLEFGYEISCDGFFDKGVLSVPWDAGRIVLRQSL